MKYSNLGRTGLKVSRIGLGTMNFGMETSEADSHALLDAALDAGINFVDTADVTAARSRPTSSRVTGSPRSTSAAGWPQGNGRRDKIVLATKLYQPMGAGPNDRGLSAYHIRKACEDSLRRLVTDHIDLYQTHDVDRSTPWEEIWQAMEQLVTAGKLIYRGSSNFAGWQIATAQGIAASRHFMGLVSEQSLYNLAARTVELEVIPALRHFGLGLIPYSPLGGGLLGGALQKAGQGRRADDRMQQQIQQLRPQLER